MSKSFKSQQKSSKVHSHLTCKQGAGLGLCLGPDYLLSVGRKRQAIWHHRNKVFPGKKKVTSYEWREGSIKDSSRTPEVQFACLTCEVEAHWRAELVC